MNQYNDQIDEIFKPSYLDEDDKKKQEQTPPPVHLSHPVHPAHPNSHSDAHSVASKGQGENLGITINSTTLGNGPISNGIPKIKFKTRQQKQRSRSLPIINYKSSYDRKHPFNDIISHHNIKFSNSSVVPLIPPINSNSLKEIELNEILKNPQLRHDIIFDPQLQFRPNLDGEKGRRKKNIVDRYWLEIYKECLQFFNSNSNSNSNSHSKHLRLVRLPNLFKTLKEILVHVIPNNQDKSMISDILDIELIMQQLKFNNFDFLKLSNVLNKIFKNHCAPIRDDLVNKMLSTFEKAFEYNNCSFLIQGLQKIFQILECMKLDIANHQIRVLRPVLIETAIDFEKDYFNQLIIYKKFNVSDSVSWFKTNYINNETLGRLFKNQKNPDDMDTDPDQTSAKFDDKDRRDNMKLNLIYSIFDLLSCKKSTNTSPQSLTFDHTRLILLRADIRQVIIVNLCTILFKNMVINNNLNRELISEDKLQVLKKEILSIVTDSNGNIKWTKNIEVIALQLIRNLHISDSIDNAMLEFASNWLMKQIQPTAKVYQLMEDQLFKNLLTEILPNLSNNQIQPIHPGHITAANGDANIANIASRVLTVVNFNWCVFGEYYASGLAVSNDC